MKKNTSTAVVVSAKSDSLTSTPTLSPKQAETFKKLEQTITDNYKSSFELAAALAQIREQELYRAEFKTFEEYCKKRWEYSRSYCERLADTNGVMLDLKGTDLTPQNEGQARVFVNLNTDQRVKLAEAVTEEIDDSEITASVLNTFKRKLFPTLCPAKPAKLKDASITKEADVPAEKMPTLNSLAKLYEAAKETLQVLVDGDCDDSPVTDQLRAFLKEVTPWVGKQGVKA